MRKLTVVTYHTSNYLSILTGQYFLDKSNWGLVGIQPYSKPIFFHNALK